MDIRNHAKKLLLVVLMAASVSLLSGCSNQEPEVNWGLNPRVMTEDVAQVVQEKLVQEAIRLGLAEDVKHDVISEIMLDLGRPLIPGQDLGKLDSGRSVTYPELFWGNRGKRILNSRATQGLETESDILEKN